MIAPTGRKKKIAKIKEAESSMEYSNADSVAKKEDNRQAVTPSTTPALSMNDGMIGSNQVSGMIQKSVADNYLNNQVNQIVANVKNNVLDSKPEPEEGAFEAMLRKKRDRYIQDKTDALKMQKYYALADTLSAIGKMGGAAVGGAIGGNVMDSAPAVGEYKENRGYIDAFEKAKRATERLDKLDDTEFSLAYTKAQRDEQRAYEEKKRAEDREYNENVRADERKWQEKNTADTRKWQEDNAKEERNWKDTRAKEDYQNQITLRKISNSGSSDTYKKQFDTYHPKLPVEFKDGTAVQMNDIEYEALFKNFVGKKIGDTTITQNNFDYMLRSNPDVFRGYLVRNGFLTEDKKTKKTNSDSTRVQFPLHMSRVPEDFRNKGENKGVLIAANENIDANDEELLKSLGVTFVD